MTLYVEEQKEINKIHSVEEQSGIIKEFEKDENNKDLAFCSECKKSFHKLIGRCLICLSSELKNNEKDHQKGSSMTQMTISNLCLKKLKKINMKTILNFSQQMN